MNTCNAQVLKKIRVYVTGYPKGCRKAKSAWLDTDLAEMPTPENIRDKAIHWCMYKMRDLMWRDCHVLSFGQFSVLDYGNGLLSTPMRPDIQLSTLGCNLNI